MTTPVVTVKPSNELRIASLDEILAREDEIWRENWHYGTSITKHTNRSLRTPFRMIEAISYGFAPLVWDLNNGSWLFSRRAACLHCGHVVATNQPSWMRKHARKAHGIVEFAPLYISKLRQQQKEV